MKKDYCMLRLPSIFGPQWIQAYALIDLEPGVDAFKFRDELTKRLKKFHEVENYLGGVPGDLFIGFFACGQTELLQEIGKIKAMKEVRGLKEWAIANFPVGEFTLTKDDWLLLKNLRGGNVTQELAKWFKPDPASLLLAAQGHPLPPLPMDQVKKIAGDLGFTPEKVKERLEFLKSIPKGVILEVPDPNMWEFAEIHFAFRHATFEEKLPEFMKIGMPFYAESHSRQGALMMMPTTIQEMKTTIKKISMIPGVRVVDYAFSEDMLWTQPWLDDFIEEQLKKSK